MTHSIFFFLFYIFVLIIGTLAYFHQRKMLKASNAQIAKENNLVIKPHNHAKYKKADRGHQPRASQPISQSCEKRKHNPVAISKGLPAG